MTSSLTLPLKLHLARTPNPSRSPIEIFLKIRKSGWIPTSSRFGDSTARNLGQQSHAGVYSARMAFQFVLLIWLFLQVAREVNPCFAQGGDSSGALEDGGHR